LTDYIDAFDGLIDLTHNIYGFVLFHNQFTNMPAPIPEIIKSRVVSQWFQGLSRDAIALSNSISKGAVSNIIRELEDALSRYEVDALRELGKVLKLAGLSAADCAIGFRIVKLFSDRGIDAERAEHFAAETYKKCEIRGITPSKIITSMEDLIKFSDKVRLPEIEDYINQKTLEKRELEETVQGLKDKVSILEKQKLELEESMDFVLEQKRNATDEMEAFFEAKKELDECKVSITPDVKKFAKTVRGITEYGYEPKRVLEVFEDIHYLARKREALDIAIAGKQENLAKLNRYDSYLQKAISLHLEKISVYNELEKIGFGSKELKLLLNTVLDIMRSNGISHWLAVNKFFEDVRTKYNAKVGFEGEKEDLSLEIKILKEEREKALQSLKTQYLVGPLVMKLLQLGLTEDDILKAGEMYLNLLTKSYSVEDLAKGMTKTVDMMITTTTGHMKTATDYKVAEILGRVRHDLSELDFNN
jgi:hypothetical protein